MKKLFSSIIALMNLLSFTALSAQGTIYRWEDLSNRCTDERYLGLSSEYGGSYGYPSGTHYGWRLNSGDVICESNGCELTVYPYSGAMYKYDSPKNILGINYTSYMDLYYYNPNQTAAIPYIETGLISGNGTLVIASNNVSGESSNLGWKLISVLDADGNEIGYVDSHSDNRDVYEHKIALNLSKPTKLKILINYQIFIYGMRFVPNEETGLGGDFAAYGRSEGVGTNLTEKSIQGKPEVTTGVYLDAASSTTAKICYDHTPGQLIDNSSFSYFIKFSSPSATQQFFETKSPVSGNCRIKVVATGETGKTIKILNAETDEVLETQSVNSSTNVYTFDKVFDSDTKLKIVFDYDATVYAVRVNHKFSCQALKGDINGTQAQSITISSANGSGSSLSDLEYGTTVQFSATAKSGYVFYRWTTDREGLNIVSSSANYTTPITENTTLYAQFVKSNATTVTITAQPNVLGWGSVNPTSSSVLSGASTKITAVPASGYHFVRWAQNSDGTSYLSPDVTTTDLVLTNVSADRTIYAIFEQDPQSDINITSVHGSVAVSENKNSFGHYDYGRTLTLTATPDAGYRFTGWTVTGGSYTDNGDRTLTITTADPTYDVTATFVADTRTSEWAADPRDWIYGEQKSSTAIGIYQFVFSSGVMGNFYKSSNAVTVDGTTYENFLTLDGASAAAGRYILATLTNRSIINMIVRNNESTTKHVSFYSGKTDYSTTYTADATVEVPTSASGNYTLVQYECQTAGNLVIAVDGALDIAQISAIGYISPLIGSDGELSDGFEFEAASGYTAQISYLNQSSYLMYGQYVIYCQGRPAGTFNVTIPHFANLRHIVVRGTSADGTNEAIVAVSNTNHDSSDPINLPNRTTSIGSAIFNVIDTTQLTYTFSIGADNNTKRGLYAVIEFYGTEKPHYKAPVLTYSYKDNLMTITSADGRPIRYSENADMTVYNCTSYTEFPAEGKSGYSSSVDGLDSKTVYAVVEGDEGWESDPSKKMPSVIRHYTIYFYPKLAGYCVAYTEDRFNQSLKYANYTSSKDFPVRIFVPNGDYDLGTTCLNEVPDYVSLIGEDKAETYIHSKGNASLPSDNATFYVSGEYAYLQDLRVENEGDKGVAILDKGTRNIYYQDSLVSSQQTFFSKGNWWQQGYMSKVGIKGNYAIFGGGDFWFQNCNLNLNNSSSATVVDTKVGSRYGFVFDHSTISNGANGYTIAQSFGDNWNSPASIWMNSEFQGTPYATGYTSYGSQKVQSARFYEYNNNIASGHNYSKITQIVSSASLTDGCATCGGDGKIDTNCKSCTSDIGKCKNCGGSGTKGSKTCSKCNGTGKCPTCGGDGISENSKDCSVCSGNGQGIYLTESTTPKASDITLDNFCSEYTNDGKTLSKWSGNSPVEDVAQISAPVAARNGNVVAANSSSTTFLIEIFKEDTIVAYTLSDNRGFYLYPNLQDRIVKVRAANSRGGFGPAGTVSVTEVNGNFIRTVNLNKYGYASFSDANEVQIKNALAYKATFNADKIELIHIDNDIVPANTGVILFGQPGGTADVCESNTGAAALTGNDLLPNLTATNATALKTNGGFETIYVLKDNMIKRLNDGRNAGESIGTLGANKAYFGVSSSPANSMRMVFGFEPEEEEEIIPSEPEETAIEQVEEVSESEVVYNLQGLRTLNRKGLLIRNGKVILVR